MRGGVLSPGEPPCTFSISLQIPAGATPGSYTNTTSEITSEIAGFPLKNAPGTADVQITPFTLSREFTNDPVFAGDAVDLTFTLTNFTTDPVTDISFSDNLSQTLAGLVKNATPISNSCASGTEVGNASTLFFTGFSLSGGIGQSCSFTISLDVPSGALSGSYPGASSSVSGTWNATAVVASPADDILEIIDAEDILTLTKSFSGSAAPGDIIDLDFVLSYVGGSTPTATNISFSDDLDAVLTGLTALAVINNTCTVSPVMPSNVINFSGQTLNSGNACSFTVQIKVPINAEPGDYTNTTSTVTATGITGNEATDVLTIIEVDHELPQADAGPDQDMVQCNGVNGTSVTLDGSASSSIHPPIQSYTWTENGVEIATGVTPTVLLSPGEHTILLTVVDALDAAVDEVIITIVDTQNPVLTCPDGTGTSLTLAADDQCQALLPDYVTEASVSDNCESGLAIIQSPVPGTLLAGNGTTQLVTLSATDAYGNVGSCSFTVEVEDQTDPVITCGGDILQNTDPGICESVVTFADPIASDNCGIASVICNPPSGSAFPVGTTTVTCTATDVNGNTAQCTFDVIVEDKSAPTAACMDIDVQLDATGNATISGADIDDGSSDACGMVTLAAAPSSFTCNDVGPNSVILTVTDPYGNFSTCTSTVTILDDNAKPDVSISQSELPQWCQGDSVVLSASPTGALSYMWSTGETSESITVGNGTYDVTVSNGCSNTASIVVNFFPEDLLSSYTIISTSKEVTLKKNNMVLHGGVGVLEEDEKAKIEDNSSIVGPTTFVFADEIEVKGGSSVSTEIIGTPSIVLPAFIPHTASGGNDVKVNKNDTVTLSASVYKKVELEDNSVVTFMAPDLSVEEFKVKEGVKIIFDQCTEIKVEKGLDFDKSVVFNPTKESVTLYAEKADIKEGSNIVADIYTSKELKAKGNQNDTTFMVGMFIGEKIDGDDHVIWDWNPDCTCDLPSSSIAPVVNDFEVIEKEQIQSRPNPFSGWFLISGKIMNFRDGATISIVDLSSREVFRQMLDSDVVELDIDAGDWAPGPYIVLISNGRAVQSINILKTH